ncbi:hypothetical protein HYPSUDRAFT_46017 [Hypholoma sublateritium FD-334 SS-4]|uniref:Yeast cell wall synthesis Kre9/Knh1-like N-terminal domain-containing protein n=1 Tax=Hypholoma sublateritium (strain FD-334 SS-4) TaxID=945553 RepID=A0A0D2PC10_HYPSF|nr:hypothetical protein HYPSUDRAFT_46017 [Hypholoma sublateritium FD-334 SS-4]
MFSKVFIVLATASAACATVFVTSPVAATTFTGGQQAVVTWQDSGVSPTLADFGPSKISIYAGNAQQQTLLQTLDASTDVSKVSQLTITPDASIGPNSSEYFIRFESLSLKDATQSQYPALAFSAKFTMTGMTGVFTAEILSQIAGQSTAPLASQTAASVASTTAQATTTSASKSAASTASSTKATASSTATASSAMGVRVGWTAVALSALIGVSMF